MVPVRVCESCSWLKGLDGDSHFFFDFDREVNDPCSAHSARDIAGLVEGSF